MTQLLTLKLQKNIKLLSWTSFQLRNTIIYIVTGSEYILTPVMHLYFVGWQLCRNIWNVPCQINLCQNCWMALHTNYAHILCLDSVKVPTSVKEVILRYEYIQRYAIESDSFLYQMPFSWFLFVTRQNKNEWLLAGRFNLDCLTPNIHLWEWAPT